jgi:hypothetical protein
MASSPLSSDDVRRAKEAFASRDRLRPVHPFDGRLIPIPHISVCRLSMRERVGRLRRDYPGMPRAAAARLLRARGAVVYETRVSWHHPIPLRAPVGELGGFLIPEEIQIGAERMRAAAEIGAAFRMPARLLAPEGEQNAPAQRDLLGLPVKVVDLDLDHGGGS